jgi:hypothetical protein
MIAYNQILAESLTGALETMAFMTMDQVEEGMSVPKNIVFSEISFSGPQKIGKVQIIAGIDFAKAVAEAYGAQENPDVSICLDALKEITNVTLGLLLPRITYSPLDFFNISVPVVYMAEGKTDWLEFTSQDNCCICNFGGFLIAARLLLEYSDKYGDCVCCSDRPK